MRREDARRLKEDVEAIEEKYGAFAAVYAENRSEAADIAGNEGGKKHWERIAATVEGEDEQ